MNPPKDPIDDCDHLESIRTTGWPELKICRTCKTGAYKVTKNFFQKKNSKEQKN